MKPLPVTVRRTRDWHTKGPTSASHMTGRSWEQDISSLSSLSLSPASILSINHLSFYLSIHLSVYIFSSSGVERKTNRGKARKSLNLDRISCLEVDFTTNQKPTTRILEGRRLQPTNNQNSWKQEIATNQQPTTRILEGKRLQPTKNQQPEFLKAGDYNQPKANNQNSRTTNQKPTTRILITKKRYCEATNSLNSVWWPSVRPIYFSFLIPHHPVSQDALMMMIHFVPPTGMLRSKSVEE